MIRKKNYRAFICAILACMLMVGCGKSKEEAAPVEEAPVETVEDSNEVEELDDEEISYSDVELTQSVDFEDVEGVSIRYPENMDVQVLPNLERTLLFNPTDQSDDAYASILVSLVEVKDFDKYMSKGSDLAEKACTYILANMLNTTYGDTITDYVGTSFEDGGDYWSLTGFVAIDGNSFEIATDDMVSATSEIRYVGPNGYAVLVNAMSLDKDIDTYYNIARDMIGTVDLGDTWSTSPKQAPSYETIPEDKKVTPTTERTTTKKNKKRRKNEEPLADPFYWYDEDGDLWYFDGYDSIFIGFGDDYYLDGGELMESNDAGWEYDDFINPWSDFGDIVEEWNDSEDDFEGWSEVGDYDDSDDYYYEDYDDSEDYDDYYYDDSDDYYYEDYDDSGDYDDYDYDDSGDEW